MLRQKGRWNYYKYPEIFHKHIHGIQLFAITVIFNYGVYLKFFSYLLSCQIFPLIPF